MKAIDLKQVNERFEKLYAIDILKICYELFH